MMRLGLAFRPFRRREKTCNAKPGATLLDLVTGIGRNFTVSTARSFYLKLIEHF
jgi:hypothetical protein